MSLICSIFIFDAENEGDRFLLIFLQASPSVLKLPWIHYPQSENLEGAMKIETVYKLAELSVVSRGESLLIQ